MQLYMLRAEREKKPTTSMAIIAFKPLKIDGNERVFDIKHTHSLGNFSEIGEFTTNSHFNRVEM